MAVTEGTEMKPAKILSHTPEPDFCGNDRSGLIVANAAALRGPAYCKQNCRNSEAVKNLVSMWK